MSSLLHRIQHSLVFKIILVLGCVSVVAISIWAFFSIRHQKKYLLNDSVKDADRISKTIKLGTHYAMMLNSRDDINQIIQNVSKQKEIENIRIYNKKGYVKFSNIESEVNKAEHLDSEACHVCHLQEPPLVELSLEQRKRIFTTDNDEPRLGIITPIYNEPGCSEKCHFHNKEDEVLGALDVVVSLEDTEAEIMNYEKSIFLLAGVIFIVPSIFIFLFIYKLVIRPVQQLTEETKNIASPEKIKQINAGPESEIGKLARAFTHMSERIHNDQKILKKQKDEYRELFERVPCLITVQDRNYKLINYNKEFYRKYNPGPGDYCYQAYKGRNSRCEDCPVEKTFQDGRSHYSEEQGMSKDGTMEYWIVRTSPVKNARGEIVAAMEINLDITERKELEDRLEQSEKKYHAIFNNIPNPVFVLDYDSLAVIDCNQSVTEVYGFAKEQVKDTDFSSLFVDTDTNDYAGRLRTESVMNSVKHYKKDGQIIFVDIWISPSLYPGRKVLLVTTSDITERLETEAQLNQAAKLATLGEMATGVAHELNQPLSVIKTSSSFFVSKIRRNEQINLDTLNNLLLKIDSNIDRASKIITHMRDFARKSDTTLERVDIRGIIDSATEIFSQQLKVRGIDIIFDIQEDLPFVKGDGGRLEQVIINLLINARDAIEAKPKTDGNHYNPDDIITVRAFGRDKRVYIEICDTGTGIPEDVADKIFEPFFTTKEVGKGTGLGLSISYGIVRECKGEIKVLETSSNGTVFQINLPEYILEEG
ncbi:MAG: PAS domain S-box protein [Desulfobacteraceae bacterium]